MALTVHDLTALENHIAAVSNAMGICRPPCFWPEDASRFEIDLRGRCLDEDMEEFSDLLAQSLGRKGYDWDVWIDGMTVCVSEAASDEEEYDEEECDDTDSDEA